jgi:hypothetical protein
VAAATISAGFNDRQDTIGPGRQAAAPAISTWICFESVV